MKAGLKQHGAKNLAYPVTSLPRVTSQFFVRVGRKFAAEGCCCRSDNNDSSIKQIKKREAIKTRRGAGGRGGGVSRGGAARTAGLARDWRSLRRLTDVPPGPLKGLLTHFDYSGPLVTQNITSSETMNPQRRLSSL